MTDAKRPTLATGIYYRDPAAALKWLEQAFGFETTLLVTSPDGGIAHSEMRLGDGMIMVGGEYDERHKSPVSTGGVNTHSIHVQLDHGIDAHYERARKAGAKITRELADQPYGDRVYAATDYEGHSWSFGQTIVAMTTDEMAKATNSTIREQL
jgi:uncharacterized glyoxalase superfamily protein PhnB